MHLEYFSIGLAGEESVNGSYEMSIRHDKPGVMRRSYVKEQGQDKTVIRALDPFDNKWQIASATMEEHDEEGEREEQGNLWEIMYTWKSCYSSTMPPKHGWIPAIEERSPAPSLSYSIRLGY